MVHPYIGYKGCHHGWQAFALPPTMTVTVLLLLIAAQVTIDVDCFPSSDLAFPREENEIKASLESHTNTLESKNRFHQEINPDGPWDREHFPPPSHYAGGEDFGYPSSRPGEYSKPQSFLPDDYFAPPVENFRPQGSRPGENSRIPEYPQPSQYNRPGGLMPGGENYNIYPSFNPDFLSFGSPSNNKPSRPTSQQNTNSRPEESQGEGDSNSYSQSNSNTNRPSGNSRPTDYQNSSTEMPTITTSESTTKIPRRDPTNRIVYTVPCLCPYTRQYVPVCGTDGQTYGNIGILQCAQQCGSGVEVFLVGSCGRNNGHSGTISLKYK